MVKHDTKFAEKLSILAHHSNGILTRLHYMKQTVESPETRPSFLLDKTIEPIIKLLVKKFPLLDTSKVHGSPIQIRRVEIQKTLEPHYLTLLDVLEFRDVATDLLNSLATSITSFSLKNNFHLTRGFLDLLTNFISTLLLLSRIDDRKVVVALYNTSTELISGASEPNYQRLSQCLVDHDSPLRKIAEDFQQIQRVIALALASCRNQYARLHASAPILRKGNLLSLTANVNNLFAPILGDEILGDTLVTHDRLTQWISICFLVCPNEIENPEYSELLKVALLDGYVLPLFRAEILLIHTEYENMYGTSKTHSKAFKQLLADCALFAVQKSGVFHQERRIYFLQSLEQCLLILTDKPGLIAPKLPQVYLALSLARDEVLWYFRHFGVTPPKTRAKFKEEEYQDFAITELIHLVLEVSRLLKSHNTIIQRYYVEFLTTYDLNSLRNVVSSIPCPEEESLLITSFVDELSALIGKEVPERPTTLTLASAPCSTNLVTGVADSSIASFAGLRLDWFRLQELMSVNKAPVPLINNPALVSNMNLIVFHTLNIDVIDEVLRVTSSFAQLWSYKRNLAVHFEKCVSAQRQARFAVVYPIICNQFLQCTHEFVPEERQDIGSKSANAAHKFLEHICSSAARHAHQYSIEHCKIGHELLPFNGAAILLEERDRANNANASTRKGNASKTKTGPAIVERLAKSPEVIERLTDIHHQLADLVYSVNAFVEVRVHDVAFCPREFLIESFQNVFSHALVNFMNFDSEEHRICRPSHLLQAMQSYIEGMLSLENYVDINMLELFSAVLQEQTQLKDRNGRLTIAQGYSSWYIDFLTRGMDSGNFCFSSIRKCFVSKVGVSFKAEEYTDLPELIALCQLIGPYGVRSLDEMIMRILSAEVAQIKGFVINNQDVLQNLQKHWTDPARSSDLIKKLKNVEELLARSLRIGLLLSFRKLLSEALATVMEARVPLLFNCVKDLQTFFIETAEPDSVDRIAVHAGISCDVDPMLCAAMKEHCGNQDYDFKVWNLLLVFYAASLGSLASKESSSYKASIDANVNNAHVLPVTIHNLSAALLSLTAKDITQIPDCQKEFIMLSSVLLLRLRGENDKEAKELDSVIIILDKFIQETPFLRADELEECIPYSMLQHSINDLGKRRQTEKKKSDTGF